MKHSYDAIEEVEEALPSKKRTRTVRLIQKN